MLINNETKEYPIKLEDFYTRFINISFAHNFQNFDQFGYSIVYDSEQPKVSILQEAIETTPIFCDVENKWIRQWIIKDKYFDHYDEDGTFHKKSDYERLAIEQYKTTIKQNITTTRYIKETSGYYDDVLNITFSTSRESIAMLAIMKNQALTDNDLSINYKANDRQWIRLTSSDIIRIYDCIFAFIQSCFEEEYNKLKGVELNVALL